MSEWDLNTPLLTFGNGDYWTIGDSFDGLQCFGKTGSGKTSSVGRNLAEAMLSADYGGLVLCLKSDEAENFERWADAAGRGESIFRMSIDEDLYFDVLGYETQKEGGTETENLLNLFITMMEITNEGKLFSGNDAYWGLSVKQCLRNVIDLIKAAKDSFTIFDIYKFIISAPQSLAQMNSEDWKKESYCFECLRLANERGRGGSDLEIATVYFGKEFPTLSEKTRSIIISYITTTADAFLRGSLKKYFAEKTNCPPSLSEEGAIIVLDFPVEGSGGELGRIGQSIYKYAWQKSILKRDFSRGKGESNRPCFLWADESQRFLNSSDVLFTQISRSQGVANVFLSQNESGYHAAIGEGKKNEVNALLGNLSTKIWCANDDDLTNEAASKRIGQVWKKITATNTSVAKGSEIPTANAGVSVSEQLRYLVEPREFTELRTGGELNDYICDVIVFKSGKRFNTTGGNYIKTAFQQHF